MNNFNLFQQSWDQFKQDCLFDDKYGVAFVAQPDLYDEDSIQLKEICVNLPQLIKDKTIIQIARELEIKTEFKYDNIRSIIIKMGYLLNIVNSFLFTQNPIPQVLPKNLAVPLYNFSKILDVKPSMGYLLNFFNWKLKDPQKDFQLENLQCYTTFTGNRGEEVFYLTSLSADVRLAKSIQKIFEINQQLNDIFKDEHVYQINQLVQDNLKLNNQQRFHIQEKIKQIGNITNLKQDIREMYLYIIEQFELQIIQLKHMFEFLDPEFFFMGLRNYVKGYSNKIVFPNGLYFEGVDKYFFNEGASGGNTPTFQIIEKAFGIKFEGLREELQKIMRDGMIKQHRDIISGFQQYSLIKLFTICLDDKELIQEFNNVILSIKKFNEKHSYYIQYYIERFANKKDPEQSKGTGNSPLDVIKNKYLLFDQFLI